MSNSAINSRFGQGTSCSLEGRVIEVVRLLRRHGVKLWWSETLEIDERDVHALLNNPAILRARDDAEWDRFRSGSEAAR